MKNLLITNTFWNIYNFRASLINELAKKGNLTIYCNKKNIKNFNNFSLPQNVKIKQLSFSSKSMDILQNFKLIYIFFKILKKEKANNLFSFTLKPNLYCGLSCFFLNISFFPTITGLGTAFNKGGFFFTFIKYLMKFSFKFSKKIFVHNKFEKSFLIKNGFSKTKIIQINGSGINIRKYKKTEINNLNLNKFLFVGRLLADKGINELIDAFILFNKKYCINLKLTLAILTKVDNISSIELKLLKKKLIGTNIRIVKNTKSVIDLYKSHGCFILPSYSEGMSRSLMEAACSGLPIICSNISGCKEMVLNGKSGFLVKTRSVNSICSALKKYYDLPIIEKKKFGRMSRLIIKKNRFDEKHVISEYLKVLND